MLCLLSVFIGDKCKKAIYLIFAKTETFFSKHGTFCANLHRELCTFFILTSTTESSVEMLRKNIDLNQFLSRTFLGCTNQQPPQRGGAVTIPIWVGSKWLLAFPRVPIIPSIPLTQTIFCLAALQLTAEEQHAASLKSVNNFFSSASLSPTSYSPFSLNEQQRSF